MWKKPKHGPLIIRHVTFCVHFLLGRVRWVSQLQNSMGFIVEFRSSKLKSFLALWPLFKSFLLIDLYTYVTIWQIWKNPTIIMQQPRSNQQKCKSSQHKTQSNLHTYTHTTGISDFQWSLFLPSYPLRHWFSNYGTCTIGGTQPPYCGRISEI